MKQIEFFKTKDLPKKSGVYIVFAKDTCLYVGSTINLYSRLQSHNKRKQFSENNATVIKYYLANEDNLAEEERKNIYLYKPLLNGIVGRPKANAIKTTSISFSPEYKIKLLELKKTIQSKSFIDVRLTDTAAIQFAINFTLNEIDKK